VFHAIDQEQLYFPYAVLRLFLPCVVGDLNNQTQHALLVERHLHMLVQGELELL